MERSRGGENTQRVSSRKEQLVSILISLHSLEGKRAQQSISVANCSSQWLEKTNLYLVESRPPSSFSDPLRPDSKLFLTLHKFVKSGKDADFWFEMAVEERRIKGILGRKPSLVLPVNKSTEKHPPSPNSDNHGRSKQTDQHSQKMATDYVFAQEGPRIDQERAGSGPGSPSTGTPPRSPSKATSPHMESETPPVGPDPSPSHETRPRNTNPKEKSQYVSVGTQTDPEWVSRSVYYPLISSHIIYSERII